MSLKRVSVLTFQPHLQIDVDVNGIPLDAKRMELVAIKTKDK